MFVDAVKCFLKMDKDDGSLEVVTLHALYILLSVNMWLVVDQPGLNPF